MKKEYTNWEAGSCFLIRGVFTFEYFVIFFGFFFIFDY